MNTEIIFVPTKKYVYFDEEGNLLSISNNNNDKGNYLETSLEEVTGLINGNEQFHQYCVLFDTVKKTYVLKHRFNEEEISFDINNQIFYISRANIARPDLKIIQNCKKHCWQFKLDKSIRDNFKDKKISFGKNLQFSITAFNNPHGLERFLVLDFQQLVNNTTVEIKFENKIELDPTSLSVYTIKRLETYSHEVVNG